MFKVKMIWLVAVTALASCIDQSSGIQATATEEHKFTENIVMEIASLKQEDDGDIQARLRIKNDGDRRVCYANDLSYTSFLRIYAIETETGMKYEITPQSSPIDFGTQDSWNERSYHPGVVGVPSRAESYTAVTFPAYTDAWLVGIDDKVIRPIRRGEQFALKVGIQFVQCISPKFREAQQRGGSETVFVTVDATQFGRNFFIMGEQ